MINNIKVILGLATVALFFGCKTNEAELVARNELRNSQVPFTQKAFIGAIVDGNQKDVALFLTGGMDTEIGVHNSNALITAVDKNKYEIVAMLLESGTDVDAKGSAGTPLCVAAAKNHLEIAQLLIEKGADVNYLKGSINPLIVSSALGYCDIMNELLAKKANIDIQGESTKYTPLMLAAINGHTDAVTLLLDKGADITLKNYGGRTAIEMATVRGKTNCAKLILNGNKKDSEVDTNEALSLAISMGNKELITELISKGVDINANYGSIPLLSWAIFNNYSAGAKILIESGAKIDNVDSEGKIPLDYALSAKNSDIINLLQSQKKETIE